MQLVPVQVQAPQMQAPWQGVPPPPGFQRKGVGKGLSPGSQHQDAGGKAAGSKGNQKDGGKSKDKGGQAKGGKAKMADKRASKSRKHSEELRMNTFRKGVYRVPWLHRRERLNYAKVRNLCQHFIPVGKARQHKDGVWFANEKAQFC